ncbi:hypothetical protein Tco_0548455, partial [Tanacetum coccineum]
LAILSTPCKRSYEIDQCAGFINRVAYEASLQHIAASEKTYCYYGSGILPKSTISNIQTITVTSLAAELKINDAEIEKLAGGSTKYGGSGVLGAGVLGVLGQAWEGGKADMVTTRRNSDDDVPNFEAMNMLTALYVLMIELKEQYKRCWRRMEFIRTQWIAVGSAPVYLLEEGWGHALLVFIDYRKTNQRLDVVLYVRGSGGYWASMRIESNLMLQIKEAERDDGELWAIVQNVEDGKHTEFSVDDDGVVWFEDRLCVPNDQDDIVLGGVLEFAYNNVGMLASRQHLSSFCFGRNVVALFVGLK